MEAISLFSGRILLALAVCSMAFPSYAQDAPAPPQLRQNEVTLLKDFEPPPDQEYQLGRGDEISIDVLGRPELSGKHTIGPDGRVTLPIVGDIMLADKTREQASAAIEAALKGYYQQVTVSVGVDRYTSNHILLLGAVEHPGIMSFDQTPTLLEVVSRGGPLRSATGTVDLNNRQSEPNATLDSFAVPDTCMIYRGNQTMITVQLRSLLEEGSPLANMRLKRDDVVYIPGRVQYVSVLGEVGHPGTLYLSSTSTLPEFLAEAGGPTGKAGRYPNIYIVHRPTAKTPGKTTVISYKDVLSPKALDLKIEPGDIIYIPETGFNRAADVIQKLSPLIYMITFASVV